MRRITLLLMALVAAITVAAATPLPAAAEPLPQDGRPSLPDPQTFGTEHFLIHYSFSGRGAVDSTDSDGSGVPDFVERVAETLEYVWTTEIDQMGWPPPSPDSGEGGDTRMDVYLDEILEDGYAGYVDTAGGFIGDNPLTDQQERRAAYAFMVLDDDYAEVDYETETSDDLMQATVAHEFNHALQAGIDDRDPHAWLYEATATWMEDQVFPEVNDGVYYLDSLFKSPDTCLVAETSTYDDLHWYSTWLLLRHLSERYDDNIVLRIWESMRQFSGFGAIDAALEEYGTTLETETRDFAVANLLRAYAEGDLYPTVLIEGQATVGEYTPPSGVQSLAADYVRLAGGAGMLSVGLTGVDGPLTLRAVAIRGGEADVIDVSDGRLIVDPDAYDEVYLVVNNESRSPAVSECIYNNYRIVVEPSADAASPVATAWTADWFLSPYSEAVTVGGGVGSSTYRPPDAPFMDEADQYAMNPEDLDVGFETLIPASLPADFAFDYGYIMTAEDFGDSDIFYVPGGGDTANFDYLDPVGNWLSIAESPSPYAGVQDWIDGIQYYDTPGEIVSVAGVDVLMEDLSEPDMVWFSATLVLDGLFIVVDSDHGEAEVVTLIEGLVAAAQSPTAAAPEQTAPPTETAIPSAEAAAPTIAAPTASPLVTQPSAGIDSWITTSALIGLCIAGLCLVTLIAVGVAVYLLVHRPRNKA